MIMITSFIHLLLLLLSLCKVQPRLLIQRTPLKPSNRARFPVTDRHRLILDYPAKIKSLRHSDVLSSSDPINKYKLNTQHASVEDTSDSMQFIHRLRREVRTHTHTKTLFHVNLPSRSTQNPFPSPTSSPIIKPISQQSIVVPSPLLQAPSPRPTTTTPSPSSVIIQAPLTPPKQVIPSCPAGTTLAPCTVCTYIGSTSLSTDCDTRKIFGIDVGSDIILINASISNNDSSTLHQTNIIMNTFVVSPHTSETITIGSPYSNLNDRSKKEDQICGINLCVSLQEHKTCETSDVKNNLYTLLDPCVQMLDGSVFVRTSSSWTSLGVRTGDTVRIDSVDYVVETPRDDYIVTISHPWMKKGPKNNNNKSSNLSSITAITNRSDGNCTTIAYKRNDITINKNIVENHAQMPCCISTFKGSKVGVVTGSLVNNMKLNQIIRVRDEIFHIADIMENNNPMSSLRVILSSASRRPTCQGMIPRLIDSCTPIIDVHALLSYNSTTVVTTQFGSTDIQNVLHAGDRISFDNPNDFENEHTLGIVTWIVGSGGVTASGFELTEPWSSTFLRYDTSDNSIRTNKNKIGNNNGTLNMYKCEGTATSGTHSCDPIVDDDSGNNRCQDVTMIRGDVNVKSLCDMTGKVESGDEIQLCGVIYTIFKIHVKQLTLDRPWAGRLLDSNSKRKQICKICRRPKTEAQEILEEYQEKYGRCDSVLCMARLEAEERKLGEALDKEEKDTKKSVLNMETEEEKITNGEINTHERNETGLVVEEPKGSPNQINRRKNSLKGKIVSTKDTNSAGSSSPLPSSPFGSHSTSVPDTTIMSDGSINGGVEKIDEDSIILRAIKRPLEQVINDKKIDSHTFSLPGSPKDASNVVPSDASNDASSEALNDENESNDDNGKDEDEDGDDGVDGDDLNDNLDEDGTPSDSENGDSTPPLPPAGSAKGKLPKHEKDPAFDGWKPSNVPPGSSKTFKRFMKCELCGKDNDVLNPLFMINPSNEPPMSNEEYMKKKTKAAETMAAQSTPPGYLGVPNKPWLASATEQTSNAVANIKYCPDDWLDLGVGDHIYPIDPDNPVGHKCKNLLNIGKCKEPGALISDLAVKRGLDGPRGTYIEDFSQKKYKSWNGKYMKCKFARECRTPWKGFDHMCGVTRWWLKQTEQNSYHKFNEANGAETPVKWPE